MDPHWNGPLPSGSITCLMCRGSLPFRKEEPEQFTSHLKKHHEIFYHHQLYIAVNLLDQDYLKRICDEFVLAGKVPQFVGEEDKIVTLEEVNDEVVKDTTKSHSCKTCDARFDKLGDLSDHVNQHREEENRIKEKKMELEKRELLERKAAAKRKKDEERKRIIEEERERRLQEDQRRMEAAEHQKRVDDHDEEEMIRNEMEEERIRKEKQEMKRKEFERIFERNRETEAMEEERIKAEKQELKRKEMELERLKEIEELKASVKKAKILHQLQDPESPKVVIQCDECNHTAKTNFELRMHKRSHQKENSPINKPLPVKVQTPKQTPKRPFSPFSNETVLDNESNTEFLVSPPEQPSPTNAKKLKPAKSKTEDSEDYNNYGNGWREGMSVQEIIAASEYFTRFPGQIKRGSTVMYDHQEPTMPPGWMFKEINRPNGRTDKEYCSPDEVLFRSRRAMVEYMKFTGKYSEEVVMKAQQAGARR